MAGAAVQWLRDGLQPARERAPTVEEMAQRLGPGAAGAVRAGFRGAGAPHWVPEARGVLFGLTRSTTAADLGRATLEGVAFQVADLHRGRRAGRGAAVAAALRVDGGMARNAWFLQVQADMLGLPVLLASHSEATALGAAFLAGLQVGLWPGQDHLRTLAGADRRFEPRLPPEQRQARLALWRRAVQAVIAFYS